MEVEEVVVMEDGQRVQAGEGCCRLVQERAETWWAVGSGKRWKRKESCV